MSTDLPPENIELVRILAAVDSLFSAMPPPQECNAACVELHSRQGAYLRGEGIPWRIGGTEKTRKAGERLLDELQDVELLTLHKVARGHRRVQLTLRGDDTARSLLGFYRVADSWNLLRGVAEGVADRRGVGPEGRGIWITEGQLCEGLDGTPPELRAMCLPLLARGLLSEGITTDSEAYFTTTPKGAEAAAGPPPEMAANPEQDQRCNGFYWAAHDEAERTKSQLKPRHKNSVYIAFPKRL